MNHQPTSTSYRFYTFVQASNAATYDVQCVQLPSLQLKEKVNMNLYILKTFAIGNTLLEKSHICSLEGIVCTYGSIVDHGSDSCFLGKLPRFAVLQYIICFNSVLPGANIHKLNSQRFVKRCTYACVQESLSVYACLTQMHVSLEWIRSSTR